MKYHLLDGNIMFNTPGFYTLNYIENIFSMFRYFLRSRLLIDTRDQELNVIVKIAFRCYKFIFKVEVFL